MGHRSLSQLLHSAFGYLDAKATLDDIKMSRHVF